MLRRLCAAWGIDSDVARAESILRPKIDDVSRPVWTYANVLWISAGLEKTFARNFGSGRIYEYGSFMICLKIRDVQIAARVDSHPLRVAQAAGDCHEDLLVLARLAVDCDASAAELADVNEPGRDTADPRNRRQALINGCHQVALGGR